MNILRLIIKYLVVILLGLIIFWIDSIENISTSTTVLCIVLVSVAKLVYTGGFLFREIIKVSKNDVPYYQFLIFLALNIALIILSFSMDYFCLSEIDLHSFSGVSRNFTFLERFMDFLYFSILVFMNFGYDQVSPLSFSAKFIVSTELIVAFSMIIFILSDFISLKESLQGKNSKDDN